MSDSLLKLTNPPFSLDFDGKTYEVKRASLQKVVLYQQKALELSKEGGSAAREPKLIAYCLFLVLKDVIPELTEQDILDKTPGDLSTMEVLTTLGFINPAKAKTLLQMMTANQEETTPDSSAPSPTEPDGLQASSAS